MVNRPGTGMGSSETSGDFQSRIKETTRFPIAKIYFLHRQGLLTGQYMAFKTYKFACNIYVHINKYVCKNTCTMTYINMYILMY